MQTLEDGTREWPGAIIAISGAGGLSFRPAAFAFDTPDGMAWVEPAYADPAGAGSQAFHRRQGERQAWNRWAGEGWAIEVLPYTPGLDEDLVGDALAWFADWLKAERRTMADERERVRQLLAGELA